MSWDYAVKSDDDSKNQETNILAYAVKSDDGKRPKTLKPGKIKDFLGGNSSKSCFDPHTRSQLRLVKTLLPHAMKNQ